MRTTPFHERTAALNTTYEWDHWAGFVVPYRYQPMTAYEYMAVRQASAIYDTSPLFKYRITGPDAVRVLAGTMVRDPRSCPVGEGQYTLWCDDDGHVLEDGVLLRLDENDFLLTAVEPNLRYLRRRVGDAKADVADVSETYGIVAVQGPHARSVVAGALGAVGVPYFSVTTIPGTDIVVSRTGFTGDLGYEIWVPSAEALDVWDRLMAAGEGHGLTPMGMRALGMARLDAGMLLIGVDFQPSRHAWNATQRETPDELGLGWMVDLDDDRPFVGRRAIERERREARSRWTTVGIALDIDDYERVYADVGLPSPKDDVYAEGSASLYDRDFEADPAASWVGYATSFGFSPILKRHIGLAKLAPPLSDPGSESWLEVVVEHRPRYVRAIATRTPFWNPIRKTAKEPA